MGNLHGVTCHPAEAASPALSPSGRYSIYPPIKDERLSRPEPTWVNDLPVIPGVSCLTSACCPARHNRCEQLAHSCYAVTGLIVEQSLVGLSTVMLVVYCRSPLNIHDAPWGHYVKTRRYLQNRKYISIATPSEKERTTATGNMRKKLVKFDLRFSRYGSRQTEFQSDLSVVFAN